MEDEVALTPGIPRAGLEPVLALCGRLVDRASSLKPTWTVPRDPVDRIVLATDARCETTFRIVLDLVGKGHSPHALALTRTMAEDCEVAHWLIAERPNNVEELSADYWDWQNLRLNGDDDAEAIGMRGERADQLRASFNRPGAHWTRKSTKLRRQAVCHWCSDTSRLEALEHLFSHVDVWANAMLHHSPWGLGAAVSPRATVERPRFTTEPSWLHSWAALRFAYLSEALLLSLCDDSYGEDPSRSFAEFVGDDGTQLFDDTDRLYRQERERAALLSEQH